MAKRSWFSKLPADAQSRLLAIKEDHKAGRFGDVTQAVVVVAILALAKEQKWPVPNHADTIRRWLVSSDT